MPKPTDPVGPLKREDLPPYLLEFIDRFSQNIARVTGLMDAHNYLEEKRSAYVAEAALLEHELDSDKLPDPTDILRAAVVMLHASLEDSLRTIGIEHKSILSPDVLKRIPLSGSVAKQPKTTSAFDLRCHRGKSVEELYEQSIGDWINDKTFGDVAKIRQFLQDLGIQTKECEPHFESIQELCVRRHQIVHRADRVHGTPSSDTKDGAPIEVETVVEWRATILTFLSAVAYHLQAAVESASPEEKGSSQLGA